MGSCQAWPAGLLSGGSAFDKQTQPEAQHLSFHLPYISIAAKAMDPLSVTASVIVITDACLKVTKGLSDNRTKYRNANLTILAICSGSAVVSVSFSQL